MKGRFFLSLLIVLFATSAVAQTTSHRLQSSKHPDVSATAPSNGQCMVYVSATGKWTPSACASGSVDGSGTAYYLTAWSDDDTLTKLAALGSAGNPLVSAGAGALPAWLSIVLAGGTNTFSITNGTASLDVAAGATLNIDKSLQIATGAVVINGNAGGSSVLGLPNQTVNLTTMTNGKLCGYNSTGTAIECDKDASGGTPTVITVADTTDATSYVALFESATGDLGPKTDAGITYAADTGTLTVTALNAGSITSTASSDPSIILTDSDTADGTAKIYGRTGGSNDVVMSFWVEVGGTDTEFLDINGSTETIAALKPVTIAASQYLAFGADPADAGAIRLSNADKIMWEASAAGTDVEALSVDASEVVQIGAAGASGVTITPKTTFGDDAILHSSDENPAATAGSIKHDSSSTEASTTNLGVIKWHDGTNVRTVIDTGAAYTLITRSEYLPIRYAEDDDSVTAPAAAAEINTSSTMIGRSFAEDADNGVVFWWNVPIDFVSGIKFRVYFATDTNASANETAVFALSGCAMGSSGAIACSEGTAGEAVLELTTDEDVGELLVTGWSGAITIGGTPASGKMAKLLLIRDVTGGGTEDDMAGHALVTGIEIKYVGKINPFSDY